MQLIAFYDEEPVKAKDSSVMQMPFEDARDFTFGNEPTTVRTVYVQHPEIQARLVPYGQYDSLLMTAKFNEALRIVQTLGAHTVITRSYRGDLSRLSFKASGPKGAGSSGGEKASGEEVAFEQLGTGGPPYDPAPIAYPDAAGFEAARRAVLFNGGRHVSISIESQSNFRVDSDIAVGLKKLGFSLGAVGEKTQVRLLKLEAFFPERGKLHDPNAARLDPRAVRPAADPDPHERSLLQRLRRD